MFLEAIKSVLGWHRKGNDWQAPTKNQLDPQKTFSNYFCIIPTSKHCLQNMHNSIYCSSMVQLTFRACRWQHGAGDFPWRSWHRQCKMRVRARSTTSEEKPPPAMVLPGGRTVHSNTCKELEMLLFTPRINNLQTACKKCQQRKQIPAQPFNCFLTISHIIMI